MPTLRVDVRLPYLDPLGCEASRVVRCLNALQHQVFIEVLFAVLGALPPNPRPAGALACGAICEQQLFEASRVVRYLHALQHQVFIEVLYAVLGAAPKPSPCRRRPPPNIGHAAWAVRTCSKIAPPKYFSNPARNTRIKWPLAFATHKQTDTQTARQTC